MKHGLSFPLLLVVILLIAALLSLVSPKAPFFNGLFEYHDFFTQENIAENDGYGNYGLRQDAGAACSIAL